MILRHICIGLLSLVAATGVLSMRPTFAGPPFITDDPEPTPLHNWEVYGFSAGTAARGDTGGVVGTEINCGCAPELMLHIIVPMGFDSPSGAGLRAGTGDIELGAKYRFVAAGPNDWWPDIGTFPLIEVPTGSASRGLGAGYTSEFIPIWMQKDFGRWTTYGGGGYWNNPGPGNRNYWLMGWLLQRQVTAQLALGGELLYQTPDTVGGRHTVAYNFGGQYDFNDHYHLLFSAGRAVKGETDANQFSYYLGVQWTGPD